MVVVIRLVILHVSGLFLVEPVLTFVLEVDLINLKRPTYERSCAVHKLLFHALATAVPVLCLYACLGRRHRFESDDLASFGFIPLHLDISSHSHNGGTRNTDMLGISLIVVSISETVHVSNECFGSEPHFSIFGYVL